MHDRERAPAPLTRFVILFEGRTGSSYLIDALSSHPDIRAQGEILDRFVAYRNGLDGRAERLSTKDDEDDRDVLPAEPGASRAQLIAAMDTLMPDAGSGILAAGFKTKRRSVLDPDGFEALLRSLNVKILHMVRDNVVKQVISSFNSARLYRNTGEWNLYDKKNALPAFRIPPKKFDQILRARVEAEDQLAAYVQRLRVPTSPEASGLPVLTLHYEDILRNEESLQLSVQQFLGVPSQPLKSRVLKNTSDDLRRVVVNFEELRSAYASSPYAHMFGEVVLGA